MPGELVLYKMDVLVQIRFRLTLIASLGPPEQFISALGAKVPGFFSFNPFCCAELPPVGDGPQDDFFADGHGKIFNIRTGEFVAFVASGIAPVRCAFPDVALPAMHEQVIGQASAAPDIVR